MSKEWCPSCQKQVTIKIKKYTKKEKKEKIEYKEAICQNCGLTIKNEIFTKRLITKYYNVK